MASILSLIIFGIVVALLIQNKLAYSVIALLGLAVMMLLNLVSFRDAFKNFGSSTVVLICAMMVVGRASFDTGLAQFVGNSVINLAKGNERLVVIYSTAITAFISAFLSNVATMAIMISILTGVCSSGGKVKFKNVMMAVGIAANFGGAVTLIGSTTQLTANGLLEEYLGVGRGFNFFTFVIPGFLIIIALIAYTGFIGYPLGKRIWGNRPDYNETPISAESEYKEPQKGKMLLMAVIFVITMVLFMFCDTISQWIPAFNIGTVALLSALICVVTGCISSKTAIQCIDWNLVLWFSACLGIATGLESSGGGKLLATGFIQLFGDNASSFVVYAVFVILVTVLTQFMANSTVLIMILPTVFSITDQMGWNTYSFAVGLTIAGAMAVATPLANPVIGMSMVAKYKFSDYLKYAGPITGIAMIILIVLIPVLFPLV